MRKAIGFSVLVIAAAMIFIAFFAVLPTEDTTASAASFYTTDEVYEIRSSSDFSDLLSFANANEYNFSGKTILLYDSIEAPAASDGTLFKSDFGGTFRGNGFSIEGLTCSMFNRILSTGVVKDLTIRNAVVNGMPFLARNNGGTIENVSCYGEGADNAFVLLNTGTIEDAFLSITGTRTARSGLFAETNNGVVRNGFALIDLTVSPVSAEGAFGFGVLATYTGGTSVFTDCSVQGRLEITGSREVKLYPFGSQTTATGCSVVLSVASEPTHAWNVAGSTPYSSFYEEVGNSPEVYDGSGILSSDYNDASDRFYLPTNGYPFSKRLFQAEGTISDPFPLYSYKDVRKLAFCPSENGADGFVAELRNHLFDDGLGGVETPVKGTLIGSVNANGYVISGATPFGNAEDINAAVSVVSGFGGDGYTGGSLTAATGEIAEGSGTKEDPYVIRSANELGALLADEEKNVLGNYAVLTQDILLNAESCAADYSLGSKPLRLTLDGLGHTVAHLFSAPFSSVEGCAKNVRFLYSSHGYAAYGVCEEITGRLENVIVEQTSSEVFFAGFCRVNAGAIVFCENRLEGGTYAFCETNEGTIERCASAEAEFFATQTDGMDFCTKKGSRVVGGASRVGSGYADLSADGFDTENDFGYETGGDEERPVLRRKGGFYRRNPSAAITISTERDAGYDAVPYRTEGYDIETIREDFLIVKDDEAEIDVAFVWTYEGKNYNESELTDVGTYTATITLSGDAFLTTRYVRNIRVEKTSFGDTIRFAENTFGKKIVTYTGKTIVDEPAPSNADALTAAGYTWTYEVRIRGREEIVSPKDVGSYTQTIRATSKNYTDMTLSREWQIEKATLSVTVGDRSIPYDTALDFSLFGADACVCAPIGEDEGKTLKDLAEDAGYTYAAIFTTDYTTGTDVGEYLLGCSLTETRNYVLTITTGVLTVTPTDITGYVFADETFGYDGEEKSLTITGLPSGSAVSYEDNGQKNAGIYTVQATVTHKNHNTLVTSATLTVEKAEITLTASDARRSYGYVFDENDFSYEHSATKNGDSFEEITEDMTITLYSQEGVLNVGEYPVKIRLTGEARNYRFVTTDGTLTIDKVGLETLYALSLYADVRTEYTGESIAYELPIDAFGSEEADIAYTIKNSRNETIGEIVNVGTYTVTATAEPKNETATNYTAATYRKTVTVTLIQTSISFESSSYTFTYSGEDFIERTYAYTTNKIPEEGEVHVYFTQNGNAVSEIIHAGEYVAVAEYTGDGNFADARATAIVTVVRRVARLTVERDYLYSGTRLVPAITIDFEDDFEGTLQESDLTLRYTDKYNVTLGYVVAAGTYVLNAESNDKDYVLEGNAFEIVITPYAYAIPVRALTLEYGETGTGTFDGTTYEVSGNTVTLKSVYIAGTNEYTDIRFRLRDGNPGGYAPINVYTVGNEKIEQPTNYTFTFLSGMIVTVKQRTLTVRWYDQTTPIDGVSCSVRYAGINQNGRFRYELEGLAAGETIAENAVNVSYKQGASDAQIYYTGTYTVSLELTNTPNYTLQTGTKTLTVQVDKANLLGIFPENGTVRQREALTNISVRVEGLLGADEGKSVRALRGYTCRIVTEYNPNTATVGATYTVTGRFTFADYYVPDGITGTAKYTVVQGYPAYALTNGSYVYDGMEKSLFLPELEEGITARYENNGQKDVGNYTVFAYITYPTGRQTTVSATLTINKATPIIVSEDEYDVYKQTYTLTGENVNAVATYNSMIPVVEGTFSVTSGSTISAGTNTVNVLFTPNDKKNFKTVSFTKKITKYAVNENSLVWTGEYKMGKDGKVYITEPLTVTFYKEPFPEIADDLAFYRNGEIVTSVTFDHTTNDTLDVRYKGATLFTVHADVVMHEKEEPKPDVVIDTTMLACEGMSFSSDGTKYFLDAESAVIALKDAYKSDFDLMVNGVRVETMYTVNKDSGNLTIILFDKSLREALYTQTAVLTERTPQAEQTEANPEKEGGFKTYYYYIIGAGAAVLLAVAVLVILKLRK